jgi:hypothetical protein
MTWTTWGSRRVLRKCLAVSIVVHVIFLMLGGRLPLGLVASGPAGEEAKAEHIREIRVAPEVEHEGVGGSLTSKPGRRLADWDRPGQTPPVAEAAARPQRPTRSPVAPVERDPALLAQIEPAPATPELNPPEPPKPDARPQAEKSTTEDASPARTQSTPADLAEIPAVVVKPNSDAIPEPSPGARNNGGGPDDSPVPASGSARTARRQDSAPGEGSPADEPASAPSANTSRSAASSSPALAMPDIGGRPRHKRARAAIETPKRSPGTLDPVALAGNTPALTPLVPGPLPPREISEVPEVYRPRLQPNRSARAQRAGASAASEQAVERGLDWLARHQDSDGRWNGGVMRYEKSGQPVKGDTSFTAHCPPGEICFGECFYPDTDTAMTGLALLAYLGSGYTHAKGRYTSTVGRGLEFLLSSQGDDGDLRGESRNVGMYCHAIATLSLCEAYALTQDARLREPAERAIQFILASRSADGMAWRYRPGYRDSDTSILGWVILALKSAKESGLDVPSEAREGALRWLALVAEGDEGGLAKYQPDYPITPTMTAEAWVCRQFLGTGGPGAASDEAARYLLSHGPGRDPYNLYYWYYGTLSMFQHGGPDWARWNLAVRDELVRRQRSSGHQSGSWDPDEDKYGSKGGRIYSTALATLTLEVYYRYLRLYAEPPAQPRLAPGNPERSDPTLRRAGRSR